MIDEANPIANPEDILIAVCLNNTGEAIAAIQKHHDQWLMNNK
jgi:hypothetical protein